jgi:hypothetical protein
VPTQLAQGDAIILNLNDPDFTTATRWSASVNKGMGDGIASIIDGGSVRCGAARYHAARRLPLDGRESAGRARQRRGQGDHQFAHRHGGDQQHVSGESGGRVARFAVGQHQRRATVSQPAPFAKVGQTTVVTNSTIKVDQGRIACSCSSPAWSSSRSCMPSTKSAPRPAIWSPSGSAQGGRRAAGRAHRDLNDHASIDHPVMSRRPALLPADTRGNTYTDLNGLAALKNPPNSPEAIRAVAQQVEALFLQMMLKSMRDASAGGEPTAMKWACIRTCSTSRSRSH